MFDITTDEHDSVMVSVEQRDVKADWVAVGENKNTIGFYIIQVGYVVKKSTEVELRRFQRSQCRKGKVLALYSLGRGFESGAPRLVRECIVQISGSRGFLGFLGKLGSLGPVGSLGYL